MNKLKAAILAVCVVAGPLASSSAFAGWEIYNGTAWTTTNSVTISGPTSATVNGIPAPCTANFTLSVNAGVPSVSAASFTGSSTCTNIIVSNFPWSVSGTASGTSVTTVIGGVAADKITITILGKTCTGAVTGTLANAHPNTGPANNGFTFPVTSLAVTGGGTCTVKSNPSLTSSKPIRLTP